MQIKNYSQTQYKPYFSMKIADPTTYSTTVFNAMCDFIGKHSDKFSPNAVIRESENKGRRFSETIIDDGVAKIRLGETDIQIINTLKRFGEALDTSA